jgi:UDP-glucose/GDP-mannose dehydrogenase family, NAD binding domain
MRPPSWLTRCLSFNSLERTRAGRRNPLYSSLREFSPGGKYLPIFGLSLCRWESRLARAPSKQLKSNAEIYLSSVESFWNADCTISCSSCARGSKTFRSRYASGKSRNDFNFGVASLSQSISIFGLGYVGSVSAACFASTGNRVLGVDVNRAKVEMLESGLSPIVEAGMSDLVAEAARASRLHATTDPTTAVLQSDISFVCVGTPSLRNGKLDLTHVEKVAREIGLALKQKVESGRARSSQSVTTRNLCARAARSRTSCIPRIRFWVRTNPSIWSPYASCTRKYLEGSLKPRSRWRRW